MSLKRKGVSLTVIHESFSQGVERGELLATDERSGYKAVRLICVPKVVVGSKWS